MTLSERRLNVLLIVIPPTRNNPPHEHQPESRPVPQNLPPFAGFQWMPSDVYTVLPSALGLAFVTSVNLLVTSRVVDHFRGRHAHVKMLDADRELGAYGIANLAAGMFGAPMSVGIPARSLASQSSGSYSTPIGFAAKCGPAMNALASSMMLIAPVVGIVAILDRIWPGSLC